MGSLFSQFTLRCQSMNGSLTIKKHANKIVNGFLLDTKTNAQKKKKKKKSNLKTKRKNPIISVSAAFCF